MIDLIDRQAAIDALTTVEEMLNRVLDDTDVVGNEREKFAWGLGLIESCVDVTKDLPSAQPETATWVPESDRRNHWHCSKCGYVIGILRVDAKFCPNCGAIMDLGVKDE